MRNKDGRKITPSFNQFPVNSNQCTHCDQSCPNFDLCKKRIFIVGGVERMECLFRSFIEECGGELDYHCGSMQGGTKKLEKCLQRADVIICPINCISHGACIKVKDMAKKYKKDFHMLPTGSISAVKRLLQENYA